MSHLNDDHPDANCVPGDKRTSDGTEYTFGENQYTSFWRAGPKDGTVICSKDYPHGSEAPYRVGGLASYRDFDDATRAAKRGAKTEYERALATVKRYEQEPDTTRVRRSPEDGLK